MSEDDPDWSTFETYEGPDEDPKTPRWLSVIFHYLMIVVILLITFSIGGFLGFILAYDRGVSVNFILSETPEQAWTRFIIGGSIAVILLFYWRYRRIE